MMLTCPSCATRYVVNPSSIGRAGRDVRCAKCGHTWFEAAPADVPMVDNIAPTPEQVRPIPPGSGLPVPVPPSDVTPALRYAAFTAVAACLVAALVLFQPTLQQRLSFLTPAYSLLGLNDTRGIVLADVEVDKIDEETYSSYTVRGALINEAKGEKAIPTVRITLLDDKGKTYRYWDFKQGSKIKPGERLPFTADKLDVRGGTIAHVLVEVGNAVELSLRD